jgi:hypothetical protein
MCVEDNHRTVSENLVCRKPLPGHTLENSRPRPMLVSGYLIAVK